MKVWLLRVCSFSSDLAAARWQLLVSPWGLISAPSISYQFESKLSHLDQGSQKTVHLHYMDPLVDSDYPAPLPLIHLLFP